MTEQVFTSKLLEEAAEFHTAQVRADFDWGLFAQWLERGPAHRAAYQAIAELDADIMSSRNALYPALSIHPAGNDNPTYTGYKLRRTSHWVGLGLAASFIAALFGPLMWRWSANQSSDNGAMTYATGVRETRRLALADGIAVTLDRNSAISVDHVTTPKIIRVVRGQVYFAFQHHANNQVRVMADAYSIYHIGTVFNIVLTPERFSVAVALGHVMLSRPGAAPDMLNAGEEADNWNKNRALRIRRVRTADIAAWQQGDIIYDETPLPLIASDLSRYTRRSIHVVGRAQSLRFSGVLRVEDGQKMLENFQLLLPIDAQTRPDGGINLLARDRP
ncbi:MAG: FecR domain-containing protein [Alphaproteobacteria bacterium]|nr:FecR domain-containing protein [Alphaproteobacteria bacterium]MDE2041967.1 FecR domain-containing protein [Alphaproteobacteria bacterium]MDE2340745.1 FecR domain-containing protein [Alphaproteobacteria bacterium]